MNDAFSSYSDSYSDAPIGIFDSGYGGLTVVRAICERLPHENIVFVGDSARCPYGSRDLAEVDEFVQEICRWLIDRGVKMIVIACNTGTAAGLAHAQQTFSVPIIGVVEPGARAAVHMTTNRKVGVIATQATIESDVYAQAIHHLDAGVLVYSAATPRFVEIAEAGVKLAASSFDGESDGSGLEGCELDGDEFESGGFEGGDSALYDIYVRPEFEDIAREYLEPMRERDIDTLVLGCTHYPLLEDLIGKVMGSEVTLVSSAEETARDVEEVLTLKGALAGAAAPRREIYTTADDVDEFKRFGQRVLGFAIDDVSHASLGGDF